ncbi:DUF6881 domain-containing protein [Arthrobacter ramosus]|uniref:DUF6881 domain-containing protein n=1 Tax=Arthrobacter ramosus TaxID=1672 RepID=A0ABV5Y5R9_ARTRM|nr:hypothetical protein [Arthrobacter ramosus]
MKRYQRLEWHHGYDEDPTVIYSEIDAKGFETCKVEQFRGGTSTFADESTATGSTWLAEVALPSLEEIAGQTEFKAEAIDASTFEDVWRSAHEERS